MEMLIGNKLNTNMPWVIQSEQNTYFATIITTITHIAQYRPQPQHPPPHRFRRDQAPTTTPRRHPRFLFGQNACSRDEMQTLFTDYL